MKRRKIYVQTVPNGYSVEIDGKGYLYNDEEMLLAGCLYHIMAKDKEEIDPEFARNIMEAAAAWPTVGGAIKANALLITEKKNAQKECNLIRKYNRKLQDKMEKLEKKIATQSKQLDECHDKIAELLLLTKCMKHKDIK